MRVVPVTSSFRNLERSFSPVNRDRRTEASRTCNRSQPTSSETHRELSCWKHPTFDYPASVWQAWWPAAATAQDLVPPAELTKHSSAELDSGGVVPP